MKIRRFRFFIPIVLSSSIFLVFLYSTLRSEEVHTHSLFVQEVVSAPELQNDVNVTSFPGLLSTTPLVLPTIARAVVVSETFRKSVPQSSAYWNRKQHFLFRQLDSKRNFSQSKKPGWSKCTALSMETLSTNIQDFGSYPPQYQDFLRGMDCRNPPLLIDQPHKCQSETGDGQPFLLFAIKSIPGNFERRQAVRQTWGQEKVYGGGLTVRTVFLLGMWSIDDPNLKEMLSFEAEQFRDILQWAFKESFYNLTLKENAFFQWAVERCPDATFIFKGDDDVFANTQSMLDYLRGLGPEKASMLYTGHVVSKASPFRDAKSKYYVPPTFYEGAYPSYAGGGGFLFSGALMPALCGVSEYISFFPIDDVYTAMCFQALGIDPEAHDGFQTFDIRQEDRENPCVHKNLLLVHQRSPQQTLRLWRFMHSPLLTC